MSSPEYTAEELTALGERLEAADPERRVATLEATLAALTNRVAALERAEADRQAVIAAVEAQRANWTNPQDNLRSALQQARDASPFRPRPNPPQGEPA